MSAYGKQPRSVRFTTHPRAMGTLDAKHPCIPFHNQTQLSVAEGLSRGNVPLAAGCVNSARPSEKRTICPWLGIPLICRHQTSVVYSMFMSALRNRLNFSSSLAIALVRRSANSSSVLILYGAISLYR